MPVHISESQHPDTPRFTAYLCMAMSCLLLAGARPPADVTPASRMQEISHRMATSGLRSALYSYKGRTQALQPANLAPASRHAALTT